MRRFLIRYSWADKFDAALEQAFPVVKFTGVNQSARHALFSRADTEKVEATFRTAVFHYEEGPELRQKILKRFGGKSICVHHTKDFHSGVGRNYVQFNGEWKLTSDKWILGSHHSYLRFMKIHEVAVHHVSTIVKNELPSIHEFFTRNLQSEKYGNAQLFNHWYFRPGISMSAEGYYPYLPELEKYAFWDHRLRKLGTHDWHDSLREIARFMSEFEPEHEKFLGMKEEEAFPMILKMVEDSGATNRGELAGRTLTRWPGWMNVSSYRSRERQQILAFHALMRPRRSKFFIQCAQDLQERFEINIIRKVHKS